MATRLQDWTRRADGPRLLVAGSYHHDDQHPADEQQPPTGPPRRRNTATAYLRGRSTPLTHDKHSPADRPVNEDIQPQGWPRLDVYVSDDGWHLVIAICRDLLNPQAVHALTETGVNLALVPAMSETLIAFGGPVAHLVGSTQAFVAVANNPAEFSATMVAGGRPARAMFGHPGFGQQTRLVQPASGEPGVALLRVRTGQLSWLPAGASEQNAAAGGEDAPLPPWAARLARQIGSLPRHGMRPRRPLRPAAALVLLTDTPHGPAVMLTERAADLAHYPGQLVFPGGGTEAGNDDPVATALREATEEVGLDPTSVQILGTLPALALPDSGYLMTPVLAWSAGPVFTGSTNLAEVNAVTTIELRQLPHPHRGYQSTDSQLGAVGAVTAVVIDLLKGILTDVQNPNETDALKPVVA
jgi:8-oxo-dGTP pyrophosphatase MutT (NUDIX family)